MSMDAFLDDFFGTTKEASASQPSAEDLEKQAQVEMFTKLAGDHGIDINKMSDAEVDFLWKKTFEKQAAEEPKKDEKKEEHLEEAKKEHEEKKAQAKILEEGTYLGKVAAHAYVAELKKIAAAGGFKKLAGEMPPQFMKHDKDEHKEEEHKHKHEEKKEEKEEKEEKHEHEKKGSFDLAAANHAFKLLSDVGADTKVATAKLNAVLTLGLKESEKVASIQDFNQALHRRALEFAEAAGYQVDWTK